MKGKILLICLISVVILPIYGVEQIPEWVKNNAKLWSENQIDNESYFNALEVLIEDSIIKPKYVLIGEEKIPEWVKNNAKLWSENQIDNESYFNALEFLMENNIIQFEYVKIGEQRVIINSTSEIFHAWSYEDDFYLEFEKSVSRDIHFKLM